MARASFRAKGTAPRIIEPSASRRWRLRFGNVYGPLSGHKNSVVAKFIRDALAGETLEVYGDGKQTRDFIYVEDLLDAIQRAASAQGVGGEIFQIATSAETTISELLNLLLPALAEAGYANINLLHSSPRLGDVRRNFSDTSKARTMLGWQSDVALSEGLKRTVAWFLSNIFCCGSDITRLRVLISVSSLSCLSGGGDKNADPTWSVIYNP